ncbi:MAG: carbamoyl-phosphate synthase large subunit [Legionellales bacterium]|nr:carbamoyl-phosphate synthase large subunit [Legionellales bacterium]
MPKRRDINSILLLGAGPIVIGQACEFDYSGTQACQALREEGYRIILVNSNPATIMTDPETADATYIEPIEWRTIAKIIERERPDAILPTMGGQTALNCALDLARQGILKKYNVEMIGATCEAIAKAEDRELFRQAMQKIGLHMPKSAIARSLEEALLLQEQLGFPTIIRPCFTLGGSGGGIAYNRDEFIEICKNGLAISPTHELLLDESVIGWKEYEMEVVRDRNDNCIIVCAIENIDPMGVHTGDSITVAPAQTLTDKLYQLMRDAAIKVLREIGVDTGGSNVQFAVNPADGMMVVVEMNPRVSRSSALASKATGFPIARVAAKLAIGYTLDELKNDITGGQTPASFEPSIDYVVTKIPRFNFEKFGNADDRLTTQMKSVGEVMAFGRTFQESLQKAIRGLEIGRYGLEPILTQQDDNAFYTLRRELRQPGAHRLWYIADAFRNGFSVNKVFRYCQIDPWFLAQIEELVQLEIQVKKLNPQELDYKTLRQLKRKGFSDRYIAQLLGTSENLIRQQRWQFNLFPVYKRVDTCAGEFATPTAYLYSTYEEDCEAKVSTQKKIMILGGGPNRIGQGIEFDYCCVHAALALREEGYETIMVNCNPETVSTDYNISDRLYFEPLTLEDILEIVRIEQPLGVIVQYGGQTPLNLANALKENHVPILGTSPEAIDIAEDRQRFQTLLAKMALRQPQNAIIKTVEEGVLAAKKMGFPLIVRPSYVLGGRAMQVVYHEHELAEYLANAVEVSEASPILLDRFLENAIEVDIDAVSDGKDVVIGGIMEHIEQAGVHSGDSSCCLPPFSLSLEIQSQLREQMRQMTLAIGVVGLANGQFAIQNNEIYVLEMNPRAARTVPFVSKAINRPLAKIAARCMVGKTLAEQHMLQEITINYVAIKKAVFPFHRFHSVDPILGPEMRSTGEVMGVGNSLGEAFAKANLSSGLEFSPGGTAFVSVRDSDKALLIPLARDLIRWGFALVATHGTCKALQAAGIHCERVNKVIEGRPHIVDKIKNDEIQFIINTTQGKQATADSFAIRRSALQHQVNYVTTLAGARASLLSWHYRLPGQVNRLQDLQDEFENLY